MKKLFKSTKVVYNAHCKQYEVYYKNFLSWNYDSCYKFDDKNTTYPVNFIKKDKAEEMAIERAKAMLETVEVWRGYS